MRGGRHGGSTVFKNFRFRPGPLVDERPTFSKISTLDSLRTRPQATLWRALLKRRVFGTRKRPKAKMENRISVFNTRLRVDFPFV